MLVPACPAVPPCVILGAGRTSHEDAEVAPAKLYLPKSHARHAVSDSPLKKPAPHCTHGVYRIRIRPEPPA